MKHSKEHQLILDRVMEYVMLVGIPTKPEQLKIQSYLDVALDGSTRYKDSEVAFENLCDLVQDYYGWTNREQCEGAVDMLVDRVGVLAKHKKRETLH
jgi:hypothetical protein|tara:strand:+ start:1003 stop:1293 length:291 start_codon:yes stop_codon:yes gene_type:complete